MKGGLGLGRKPKTNPLTSEAPSDFTVTKARRPIGVKVMRALIVGAAVLLMLVGAKQLFRTTSNQGASTPTVTAQIDPGAAQSAAGQFAADYLTYDPTNSGAALPALTAGSVANGGVSSLAWSGGGWMASDLTVPGAVTVIDATHSVVAVQVRVAVGQPADSNTPVLPATTVSAQPGRPAASAPMPAGYVSKGSVWVSLQVPVVLDNGRVLCDLGGPVFSADLPGSPPAGSDDSLTTTATEPWAATFFTAYAAGGDTLAYLTTPGSVLNGLAGAVTLKSVAAWSLHLPTETGARLGVARVTWSLPGIDVTTTQSYNVTITTADNRWFATAIGPTTATPTGGTA